MILADGYGTNTGRMTRRIALFCVTLLFTAGLGAQYPASSVEDRPDVRLPSGKRQSDEILKAEYQKNLEDAAELLRLAEDLKIELEKNDRYVLSLDVYKKTEEIEKVAKRIRKRLKRF
jgi:hypothetical protein